MTRHRRRCMAAIRNLDHARRLLLVAATASSLLIYCRNSEKINELPDKTAETAGREMLDDRSYRFRWVEWPVCGEGSLYMHVLD